MPSNSTPTGAWIRDFKLPKQFSLRTITALQSKDKMHITDAVCWEIISAVATLVMVHTMYPSAQEYTILAERLITQY